MAMGVVERNKDGKKKSTRFYSSKQEKKVAKNLKGFVTPNSGATPFIKSDILLDDWCIEAKTKTKDSDSMSIKKEWLEKNLQESLFMGKKYNALVFSFGPNSKNYYIVDEDTFKEFIETLGGKMHEE